MNATSPHFYFWIRRDDTEWPSFSLRFEVTEGAGVLRVAQPGLLIESQPCQSSTARSLTGAQIRASRFLHLWDDGRRKRGLMLSRLSDDLLFSLSCNQWHRLVAHLADDLHCLLPESCVDDVEDQDTLDEPLASPPGLSLTIGSRRRYREQTAEEIKRNLRSYSRLERRLRRKSYIIDVARDASTGR